MITCRHLAEISDAQWSNISTIKESKVWTAIAVLFCLGLASYHIDSRVAYAIMQECNELLLACLWMRVLSSPQCYFTHSNRFQPYATIDNHIESVSKSCFHWDTIIRSSLDDDMAVSSDASRLDYYVGQIRFCLAACRSIARLQRAQNAIARAVVQPQSHALPLFLSSQSHLLKQLHWLPIEWRIRFKLSTLT